MLFIAGSCVTHKCVNRAGKLQTFCFKPDGMYTDQMALKLGRINAPPMANSCEEIDKPFSYTKTENLIASSIIKRPWKTEHEMGR